MSNVPQKYWGEAITLRNGFTRDYLYASDDKYNKNRRYVLTKRGKKQPGTSGSWILETDDKGETFTLKNVHSEYMYSPCNDYKVRGAIATRINTWLGSWANFSTRPSQLSAGTSGANIDIGINLTITNFNNYFK